MKDTFYFQNSTTVDDRQYWDGEDAIPYAGDGFLFVADGSGGSGCLHEGVSEAFLSDAYARSEMLSLSSFPGPEESPEFSADDTDPEAYLKESFFELDQMREYPEIDPENKKNSGYFASRIVGCLLLDLLRNDPEANPNQLWESLDACSSRKEKQGMAEIYAGILKEKLAARLADAAEKANLNDDLLDPDSPEMLLPTTLSLALYRELRNKTVEVVCLWAGDSRIYMQRPEGLKQLTADDENRRGAVTNYVNLTVPFTLNAKYYAVEPPFILFAATDGFFDWTPKPSKFLVEQLETEDKDKKDKDTHDSLHFCLSLEYKSFLEPFFRSGNMTEVKDRWEAFYEEVLAYDDSASLAFCTFGLDDYEALTAFIEERSRFIQEKYLVHLPELDRDYIRSWAESKQALEALLKRQPSREMFLADPAVKVFVKKRELENPSENTKEVLESLDRKKKENEKERNKYEEDLRKKVRENWLEIRPTVSFTNHHEVLTYRTSGDTEANRLVRELKFTKRVMADDARSCSELSRQLVMRAGSWEKQLSAIQGETEPDPDASEGSSLFSEGKPSARPEIESVQEEFRILQSDISEILERTQENLKKYQTRSEEYSEKLERLLEIDNPLIEAHVRGLLGQSSPGEELPAAWRDRLMSAIRDILGLIRSKKLDNDRLERDAEEAVNRCALENAEKDFGAVTEHFLNDELEFKTLGLDQRDYLREIRKLRSEIKDLERESKIMIRICRAVDPKCMELLREADDE